MTESSQKTARYVVDNKDIRSEAAQIYFVHQEGTDAKLVLKVLLPYKDTRYSLLTPKQRRECQIESLRWNHEFTPDVYLGIAPLLAPLTEFDNYIYLGEIIAKPDEAQKLKADGKDFVLVMHHLPQSQRLDVLLKEANKVVCDTLIELLVERIVAIHAQLLPVSNGEHWGSLRMLKKKFKHNIHLFEKAQHELDLSLYRAAYDEFKTILDDFYNALGKSKYPLYFKQRIAEGQIKRCHGDLKSTNIWIMPYDYIPDQEPYKNVKILDTIDFKGMYSNIDVLSDIAMLAVDIFAIVKDYDCVDRLIKSYLAKIYKHKQDDKTYQHDDIAWDVLRCYLFEKSVVCAALSVIDEHNSERGQLFLDYAKYWLMQLPHSLKLRNAVNELTRIL